MFALALRRSCRVGGVAVVLLGALLCVFAGPGRAAADDSLGWSPRFKHFSTAQYLLTGAMAGGLLATDQLLQARSEPRWQSGILLDAQARSLLGANSEHGRALASDVSDLFSLGLMLYPFAVD